MFRGKSHPLLALAGVAVLLASSFLTTAPPAAATTPAVTLSVTPSGIIPFGDTFTLSMQSNSFLPYGWYHNGQIACSGTSTSAITVSESATDWGLVQGTGLHEVAWVFFATPQDCGEADNTDSLAWALAYELVFFDTGAPAGAAAKSESINKTLYQETFLQMGTLAANEFLEVASTEGDFTGFDVNQSRINSDQDCMKFGAVLRDGKIRLITNLIDPNTPSCPAGEFTVNIPVGVSLNGPPPAQITGYVTINLTIDAAMSGSGSSGGSANSGGNAPGELSIAKPVPPLLPTALPSLTRTDSTLTCAVGEFSDKPAAVDVTLVVDGARKGTKRVESPEASTTFTYDAAWQGSSMTCEVVAKVENRVSTAYAATLTVPKPVAPAPTSPTTPVLPLLPGASTSARGFAVDSVRFGSGSAALDSADRAAIAALVKRAGTTTATYRVTGYVQGASVAATGSPTARARAQAVAAELRRLGVKPANITTRAAGGTIRNDATARRAVIEVRWTK